MPAALLRDGEQGAEEDAGEGRGALVLLCVGCKKEVVVGGGGRGAKGGLRGAFGDLGKGAERRGPTLAPMDAAVV
jgi:hypothetical protein